MENKTIEQAKLWIQKYIELEYKFKESNICFEYIGDDCFEASFKILLLDIIDMLKYMSLFNDVDFELNDINNMSEEILISKWLNSISEEYEDFFKRIFRYKINAKYNIINCEYDYSDETLYIFITIQ